jgi:hypothetical protein
MIIAYRRQQRAIFLYAFAKSESENIDQDQLLDLRQVGANWLKATDETLAQATADGSLQEVRHEG